MGTGLTVRILGAAGLQVLGAEGLRVASESKCTWVDIAGPDPGDLERVGQRFGLHPLALEDCLHEPQRPKIEVFDDHLFLIWTVPGLSRESADQAEVDAFLGNGWLVTIHRGANRATEHAVSEAGPLMASGPDRVLHAVLDHLVDGVFFAIDEVGESLERLEGQLLQAEEGASPAHLREIYVMRRRILDLHRIIAPERDIVRALLRERDFVTVDAFRYFSDVGDHLARVEDALDSLRTVATDLTDIHLSAVANRTNEIMKRLTVVATIFMPLTLITGIYGMNFRMFPELGWRFGYPGVMAIMLGVAVSMLVYFRRRGWWKHRRERVTRGSCGATRRMCGPSQTSSP
ncbi:MAG: magnesium/cobalt transporter CorA [Coriobacteriia bacterium]|nr:magnesium/cobalt transporter CorA [Coriobacteriia bacterium]